MWSGKIKDYRVLWKFSVSYLIVLLIPFMLGVVVYLQSVAILKKDALNNNHSILEQSRGIVDGHLRDMLNQGQQLAFNFKNLTLHEKTRLDESVFEVFDFRRDLSQFKLTNQFAYDFLIFYRKSGLTVTSQTAYFDSDLLYGALFQESGINAGFQDWEHKLWEEYSNGQYVRLGRVGRGPTAREMLAYVQTFPLGASEEQQSKILLMIDADTIKGLLNRIDIGSQGAVVILDRHGEEMVTVTGEDNSWEERDFKTILSSRASEIKLGGQTLILSRTFSPNNGWSYISAVPASLVYAKADTIRNTVMVYSLIAVGLGLLATVFLAYRNSRPIGEVLSAVRQLFDSEAESQAHYRYEEIGKSVSSLVEGHKRLRAELKAQLPFLQSAFLGRLLNGEFYDEADLRAHVERLEIDLSGELFVAVVLGIQVEAEGKYETKDELVRYDLMRLLVKEEWGALEPPGQSFFNDYEEKKLEVLMVFQDRNEPAIKQRLESFFRAVRRSLEEKYGISLLIAAGNLQTGLLESARSFDEAQQAIDFFRYRQGKSIVYYWEVPAVHPPFYYPIELEIRLIHALKAGDRESVQAMLQALCTENQANRELSSVTMDQFLAALKMTLIRGLGSRLAAEELENVLATAALEPFIEQMDLAMNAYALSMVQDRSTEANEFVNQVMEYTEASYSNVSLNLEQTAAHFNVLPSSLYTMFKERAGTTFADYVEKLRIDAACRLIETGEASIKTIAEKIGYSSDQTFRRAFKRVMGVSPSDYGNTVRNKL
ncbi:helix-turn-helix domain-containing protein [Cohnella cellulosilytica]|uniref:Helix-turn-helix domain-containing protein n=1 Tax=Cohnella cellulosilytica TaxID=986710 RepID=A0ABW2FF32_9BACL